MLSTHHLLQKPTVYLYRNTTQQGKIAPPSYFSYKDFKKFIMLKLNDYVRILSV